MSEYVDLMKRKAKHATITICRYDCECCKGEYYTAWVIVGDQRNQVMESMPSGRTANKRHARKLQLKAAERVRKEYGVEPELLNKLK